MTMVYIGIDPGASGAVVALNAAGEIVVARRFDGADALDVLTDVYTGVGAAATVRAAIEDVHAMPGQGVVSMFTFGVGFGRILGFLYARRTAFDRWTPQTWQRIIPAGATPKDAVKTFAIARWGVEIFIAKGCRVPHQGMIDAAAIAEFGRRIYVGEIERPTPRPKRTKRQPIRL